MASDEGYLAYVMDLLGDVPDVRHRKMMGEYVLYASGKVFGGIYDDRFLVKRTPVSKRLLPDAPEQLPYEGAKPMLLVDFEDRTRLAELVAAMLPELLEPRKRKKQSLHANRLAGSAGGVTDVLSAVIGRITAGEPGGEDADYARACKTSSVVVRNVLNERPLLYASLCGLSAVLWGCKLESSSFSPIKDVMQ